MIKNQSSMEPYLPFCDLDSRLIGSIDHDTTIEDIEELIARGASPSAKILAENSTEKIYNTALVQALLYDNIPVLRCLIKAGANIAESEKMLIDAINKTAKLYDIFSDIKLRIEKNDPSILSDDYRDRFIFLHNQSPDTECEQTIAVIIDNIADNQDAVFRYLTILIQDLEQPLNDQKINLSILKTEEQKHANSEHAYSEANSITKFSAIYSHASSLDDMPDLSSSTDTSVPQHP